jgi:hypothetical protein
MAEKPADKPLTEGPPPPDTETITEVPTQRGRVHPTVHGSGAPSEPETEEQGLVRTGRKAPAHEAKGKITDTAGLTPQETAAREAKSAENREMVSREEAAQGRAATRR